MYICANCIHSKYNEQPMTVEIDKYTCHHPEITIPPKICPVTGISSGGVSSLCKNVNTDGTCKFYESKVAAYYNK